jgi:hypothetical protein
MGFITDDAYQGNHFPRKGIPNRLKSLYKALGLEGSSRCKSSAEMVWIYDWWDDGSGSILLVREPLDEDLDKSARCLTNPHLEHGIPNAIQVLMCSVFYMTGIRNKTIYKHYVCKERWDETRFRYFPRYPLKSMPKFSYYNSQEARWCRKCADHYRLVSDYLGAMLEEHAFRFGDEHPMWEMHDFLRALPMELSVRRGLLMPRLKDKARLQLPWKNLPIKYRKKNIIAGYRAYYRHIIDRDMLGPHAAFVGTKRDVPDFLVDGLSETSV